jgi:putative inorganic carbon (HCO3(-)) transporter
MLNPTQPLFFMLAYLAVLYVRPHEFVPGFMGLPILPVLLLSSVALWVARQTKNMTAPQFKLLPWQTFLMAWSVLLSGWMGGAIQTLVDFIPIVLLFYMLATTVDSVTKLRQVFMVMSAATIPIALHCIKQAEEESEGLGWTGAKMIDGRVTYLGFLNDPNDLSMALLMIMPMQVYLLRKSGVIMKLFWSGSLFLSLYTIKLANSRGAILALGAMLFHHSILRYGLMRSLIVAPFMAAPILIFGPSRMNEMSDDEESAEGRIESWFEGFHMLASHPLFGVGKGMFTEYNYLTAHNSYVLAIAELGIIGYFVWLSSVAFTWLMARSVHVAEPKPVVDDGKKKPLIVHGQPVPAVPGKASPAGAVVTASQPAKKSFAEATKAVKGSDVQVGDHAAWLEVREGARTLWFGFTAALVAIFFLSRSYVVILYIHMALIVAMYQLARVHKPEIPMLKFSEWWGRLLMLAIGSTFGLWLMTAILLRT